MAKTYALDVRPLYSDECRTMMSKGHHEPAAFIAECEAYHGGKLEGWGSVKRGWFRTIPDSTGEYQWIMHPAKPHARGAYPATTICDMPDFEDALESMASPAQEAENPGAGA